MPLQQYRWSSSGLGTGPRCVSFFVCVRSFIFFLIRGTAPNKERTYSVTGSAHPCNCGGVVLVAHGLGLLSASCSSRFVGPHSRCREMGRAEGNLVSSAWRRLGLLRAWLWVPQGLCNCGCLLCVVLLCVVWLCCVLCCVVLFCVVLCCLVLCCVVLCCVVLMCCVLRCAIEELTN